MIVIMPGGFHPFHAGHASLYQSALKAFPNADVYVAATNDTKSRPFPFEIKEKLAKVAGVQDGRFVQVKSPFQAKEILQNYNPEEDVVVFVRSEKDRDEQPKPGGTKKDGSPAYFQPYTGKNLEPFGKHGYIAYLPTVEFGPGIKSATEIRNVWPQLNDRRKLAMVMSLYPKAKENQRLAQNIVKMLDLGMGTEEVAEAIGNVVDRSYDMTDVDDRIDADQRLKKVSKQMLEKLAPREEYVIRARLGLAGNDPMTLKQIASTLGIGLERVRQIEAKAVRKLRQANDFKNRPLDAADSKIIAQIEKLEPQYKAALDIYRQYWDKHRFYTTPETKENMQKLYAEYKKYSDQLNDLRSKLSVPSGLKEGAGDVYTARMAEIIEDLGNGYFLGDDSYDDDEGFIKAGYSVYKKEGPDQYRLISSVNMSPYRNPPGHVESEIKKIIASDQGNISENQDYLEEK